MATKAQTSAKSKARHEELKTLDEITAIERSFLPLAEPAIQDVDVFMQNLRILARTADGTLDISKLVTDVSWQDQSSDALANINTLPAMTGSLTLRKPALSQYDKLLPPQLSARIVQGVARWGAMGVVIICQVGYGKSWVSLWAMRVGTRTDGANAESVQLSDGSWTLGLADDLWTLAQNVADFKFTAGKVQKRKGWLCHEVAAQLIKTWKIPTRQVAKGTARFSLGGVDTTLTSPVGVLMAAYAEETKRTGRTFIVRWGAPDKKHPIGALEIVPMRRNRYLSAFRDQLIEATLTRDQHAEFATIVEARGTVKSAQVKARKVKVKGKATKTKTTSISKTRSIKYTAVSKDAGKRFGWVRKTLDFGEVSSSAELAILAKRALAVRLTPIRTATLSHPGIATIRRGDAIHIKIPEEGYQEVALKALIHSKADVLSSRFKKSTSALASAERKDPSLFGLPDVKLLGVVDDTAEHKAGDAIPALLPVANQGIAFVTSVVHTASSAGYTMEIQTGFTDILDPAAIRVQIDKAVRDSKKPKVTPKQAATAPGAINAPEGASQIEIVAAAAQYLSDLRVHYVYGGGHFSGALANMHPSSLDCSSSVCWVLHNSGLYPSDTPTTSSGLASGWGQAGQGSQLTVWANGGHVFMEVNAPGIGHMEGDTGAWGGDGFHWFPFKRSTSGFTPRHWPGL